MKVLALDSATSACSAALWQDGIVVAQRFMQMERGQSEVLVPMVAEVMAEAGASFAELDLLAVTVGPGAFTGIRIGLATARALALAAAKPLAGIATPEAVAAAIPPAERAGRSVLVVLDSRRDEVWVQAFDTDLAPLGDPAALLPLEAAKLLAGPVVAAGDAASLVVPLMRDGVLATSLGAPHAAQVAMLAARRWAEGTALPPEPLYLRPADVTMPK
ncbi:MAG: tRNA (adenosine(37)-N6)-threonylcarbamoyltransferase complex dimerization subunit type 1 TsaB [Rhodospirillaceae bacterium]|nr:tRNA (adenosine(37)-N6)-threonylcarbamoyltransferase complex dimerization subunit type 1 TsaB [Rhodospirillales bacterium]